MASEIHIRRMTHYFGLQVRTGVMRLTDMMHVFPKQDFQLQAEDTTWSRRWARGARGTGRPWLSAPAPGPAWAAGSCWSTAPLLWTTRTFPPGRRTNPTASAWWCDAGRLSEGNQSPYFLDRSRTRKLLMSFLTVKCKGQNSSHVYNPTRRNLNLNGTKKKHSILLWPFSSWALWKCLCQHKWDGVGQDSMSWYLILRFYILIRKGWWHTAPYYLTFRWHLLKIKESASCSSHMSEFQKAKLWCLIESIILRNTP